MLPEQSDVNQRLLPLVVSPDESSAADRAADEASVAVLAGHRVPERIVDAGLVIRSVPQRDLSLGFLSSLELDPNARSALLAEATNSIAVGHASNDDWNSVFISMTGRFPNHCSPAEPAPRLTSRAMRHRTATGRRTS